MMGIFGEACDELQDELRRVKDASAHLAHIVSEAEAALPAQADPALGLAGNITAMSERIAALRSELDNEKSRAHSARAKLQELLSFMTIWREAMMVIGSHRVATALDYLVHKTKKLVEQ